jgi:pimeloyl-ACP methyl ester carboxylesterase
LLRTGIEEYGFNMMSGWLARTRMASFGALFVVLLSPALAGSVPTGLVDVGGYRLFIECRGKGSPTVVLDAGLGGSGANWLDVQRRASKTTRVCSYDRAGRFRSDRRPGDSATTDLLIRELHSLLAKSGVPPPYVLGGHSIGGLTMRYFTLRFREEVVALVMVDSSYEAQFTLGSPVVSSRGETMDVGVASQELLQTSDLGSRPLIVLEHGIPFGPDDLGGERPSPDIEIVWRAFQKRIAQMSTNSRLVIAKRATHGIPRDQPKIVAEAIRQVTVAARRNAKLPPCTTAFPRLGGRCLRVRP